MTARPLTIVPSTDPIRPRHEPAPEIPAIGPAQAMTPVEALRAFTLSGAYAAHQERVLGSLEPAKHADFILVDQDPFALDNGRALWQTTVLQTWLGGRRVGEYGQL